MDPEVHRRLEAAVLDVFSQSDFHRANIRTIAKMAGISFTTIYRHYGSKEGLLFSFVNDWLRGLTERMADHLQGIEDLKEKLRKFFWVQLDYYERNPGVGRIIFMTVPITTWMGDKTFAQDKMIHLFLDTLRQGQAAGVLNSRVRAGVLVDIFNGMVQRTFFMWVYRGQNESLAAQANVLFEMLWRAIENPERPA
ncbi:MAG: TetR/AcrR family transcriptional regulator [Proteobacteria bacterium]|nr:TetR/AcrR family transcriptional regulator [Pseudomonadota bacterium]MBU1449637.1 TetR/AcrR family transcriptional regulator [Pseudomonadota bacterium]MBU2469948.1 TetR/AcrR family transcriptional regulator [Pseudomonadota bacterium]MBU2516946.1 TetR/AcrR family transcriptional regulator [Pseudomonadota bacterium]